MKELTKLEYQRQQMAHARNVHIERSNKPEAIEKRFWKLVDRKGEDECWPYKGHKTPAGYGIFWLAGERTTAPRFAWQLANGRPMRKGFDASHTCDNPACCNAKHIREWTRGDNMIDAANKGRTTQGERNHHAILCAEQVREIRNLRSLGYMLEEIATRYGVTASCVSAITVGRSWKHI